MHTALIVDDHDENRYLLRTILTASGYRLLEASSGVEALAEARRARPAIIISDILMPQMDGFTLCRVCKRDPNLADIPFVFYTATYTSPQDEELARKLGAARFIVKPISDEVFVSMVAEVLGEHATGHLAAQPPPEEDDTVYYRLYNEVLIHKLEEKVLELEREAAERIRAEAGVERAALQLRTAVTAANVGLWDWDLETNAVFYSREWKRQIGFDDDEISSRVSEWWDRVHPEDRDRMVDVARAFAEKRRPDFDVEFRFRHKDGSYRWILSQASLIEDDKGRPRRMLGSHVDITARRHADAERQELEAQLAQAQKLEAVGRLAGGVAHDFNNALCVIIGSAELGLEVARPEDAAYEYLQSICDAGRRGSQVVRQLLAFARKETVAAIGLDPNSALSSVYGMLARLIGEDIELTMVLQPDVWPIKIDPTHFDQVVINLLTNSRDAMPGGGRVRLATSNVTLDETGARRLHAGMAPGDYVSLEVSDSGCGMDPTTQDHIFEPFFTTKADESGTGLGLPTVLGIVERNGGRIDVRSEVGKGTTFTIFLPRFTEVSPEQEVKAVAAPERGGETVLVVEDNASLLTVVQRTLESYDYRVLTASTATEAMRISQSTGQEIDVLVTDLVLPYMNGKALAQAIRAYQPGLRVLYMSGYPAAVLSERTLIADDDPYIQKPFTPQTLAERIRQTLL
jgi:two-component system, cell cycle sensor histidine kinase and response regulator CckA